ncbi:MAG: HD domain-containing phosphohydrolase [Candidatus Acetothermia bacterium]
MTEEEEEAADKFEKLRQEAEEKLKDAIDSTGGVSNEDAPGIKGLLHELQVHQVELELQNEELRETRTRLRKMKEKYVDLYHSAPISYLTLNEEGEVLDANMTAAKKLQTRKEQLIGEDFYSYVAEEERDALYKHLRKVFKTENQRSCELKVAPGANGSAPEEVGESAEEEFHGLLESRVFENGEGEVVCRSALSDITERKELRRRQELVSSSLDQASLEIYWIRPDGSFAYTNRKVEEKLGYHKEELADMKVWDVDPNPGYPKNKRTQWWKRLKEEGPLNFESAHRTKAGETYPVQVNSHYLQYKGKEYEFAFAKDITEQKETLEQLQRSENKLRQSFVKLAETTSRVLGVRDPYTQQHERRVGELAREVGKRMGHEDDELLGLYLGGVLHDIGKIVVPETILTKPGELKDVEWEMIKSHPEVGYNQILEDTDFPWPVAEITLHHHERLDGSGYPDGLEGDELTEEVRILAAVDVVEAMSTRRPYREARSKKRTLSVLKEGKGKKFDPEVVDILVDMIEEGEVEFGDS